MCVSSAEVYYCIYQPAAGADGGGRRGHTHSFVKEQQRWVLQQQPRHREPLLLAAYGTSFSNTRCGYPIGRRVYLRSSCRAPRPSSGSLLGTTR